MEWEIIPEFPFYSVSNFGSVRNDETGRILSLTRNQHGLILVGLMRSNKQYKRAVGLLVARAFLPAPEPDTFDSVINLNGDRSNNHISNLMWRPRWFAVKFHQQFVNSKPSFPDPIQEIHTGEIFRDSWDAATKYGLLDKEILTATLNRTFVWPTYQEFRVMAK